MYFKQFPVRESSKACLQQLRKDHSRPIHAGLSLSLLYNRRSSFILLQCCMNGAHNFWSITWKVTQNCGQLQKIFPVYSIDFKCMSWLHLPSIITGVLVLACWKSTALYSTQHDHVGRTYCKCGNFSRSRILQLWWPFYREFWSIHWLISNYSITNTLIRWL